jgi:AraC-like DNA-binding protein
MFPTQVLRSEFWENLVYPESQEEGANIPLPPIVLLCISVDEAEDIPWPKVHELIWTHFPHWQQVRVFKTFIYLFSAQPQEDTYAKAQGLLQAAPTLGLTLTISAEKAAGKLLFWRTAAQRSIAAVRKKIIQGSSRIYHFNDLGPRQDPSVLLSPNEEQLLFAIKTGQVEACVYYAQKSSQELFTSHLYVLSHLRTRLRELAVLMTHAAVEAGLPDQTAFVELNDLFRALDQEHDYTRLEELYLDAATRLCKLVEQANRRPSAIVEEAKELLESSFRQDLTLKTVAEKLAVSQSHLSRLFRKETGFTFTEYLNRLRLEEAARLLLDRSLSVTDVCYQVGFQSLPHFQRLFRDFYGKSPSAYRKDS